ncbi:MAG: hypothetical protein IPN29_15995 [Saprospiraceae bacterium]|nr:hypothetical protein [Saprospiraceae bacterium]
MVIRWLYNVAMWLLELLLDLDGFLSQKRAAWHKERNAHLTDAGKWRKLAGERNITWMHCASLGEYEQGIALLRALRKIKPEDFYLVSFFSPSGYEQRKNTSDADGLFYLPIDTTSNAKRLVKAIQPQLFIGVKYEFWWNLLAQLEKQRTCVIYIAVKLRPGHYFLRSGMTWFRKILTGITHFFTQDDASTQLLLSTGIAQVTTSGDTRVKGVMERKETIKPISCLTAGKAGRN